jgi:hypothetical protein
MRHVTQSAIALLLLGVARFATAGGLELLPAGARSVARGGAVAARPEDALTLLHNPAGLVFLPSGSELTVAVDAPFHHMCVQPYGY